MSLQRSLGIEPAFLQQARDEIHGASRRSGWNSKVISLTRLMISVALRGSALPVDLDQHHVFALAVVNERPDGGLPIAAVQ